MSLATRCTHCGTIFKIVEDQLKVSEGWVRCGRCQEVFNALPTLFDMESEAPPPRRTSMPPPVAPSPAAPAAAPTPAVAARPTPVTPPPAPQTAETPPPPAPASATPPEPDLGIGTPGLDANWVAPEPAAPANTPFEAPVEASTEPAELDTPHVALAEEKLTEDTFPPEPPVPVRPAPDFDLDTRVPAEEMNWGRRNSAKPAAPTAPPEPTASATTPVEPAPAMPPSRATPLAPPSVPTSELPSTDEADALDSRYLMPSEERPAPRRRTRGPEFADAQFPTDALHDADDGWGNDASQEAPAPAPAASPAATAAAPASAAAATAAVPHTTRPPQPMPTPAGPAETPAPSSAPAAKTNTSVKRKKPAATPEFIRQAQRQAFWRQPSVRGALTGLALALLLSIGIQVTHHFRDSLAAQYPMLRPALTQWCTLAHCTLQAPMRIDDLQVDNATLLRATNEGPDRYTLTVVVRNRSALELMWPHVDLSLTDMSGKLVARRSFAPADAQWHAGSEPDTPYAPRPDTVPARQSTTLVWQLHAPGLQPAGYTAELFYP